MIKIGIDQSFTNTAICVFDNDLLIDYKVIKTVKKGADGVEYDFVERIESMTKNVLKFVEPYIFEDTHIALEGLSLARNSTTVRPLAGLYYHLLIELRKRGVSAVSIPPSTVKAFAVKGNASKEDMIKALPFDIYERFLESGYKKTTGLADLADAYFIGKIPPKEKK